MVRYLTASCIIGYFLCLPACSIGASLRRIGGMFPRLVRHFLSSVGAR
jgi:hypothetical protein